jgi:membrane protein required for colicin V production
MGPLDILIGIILVLFLIRGVMKDVTRQLFSLIELFLALLIASQSFSWAILHLPIANSPEFAQSVWAFLIIFLLLTVLMSLLFWVIQKLLNRLHPSLIDRLASACLGLVKGILVSCLLLLVVIVSYPSYRPIWNSRFISFFLPAVENLSRLFPPEFRFNYKEKSKELKLKKSLEIQPPSQVRI